MSYAAIRDSKAGSFVADAARSRNSKGGICPHLESRAHQSVHSREIFLELADVRWPAIQNAVNDIRTDTLLAEPRGDCATHVASFRLRAVELPHGNGREFGVFGLKNMEAGHRRPGGSEDHVSHLSMCATLARLCKSRAAMRCCLGLFSCCCADPNCDMVRKPRLTSAIEQGN